MKRAKTLSKQELNRVLADVSVGRNAGRNRIVILLSYYAGLHAKEIAELTVLNCKNPLFKRLTSSRCDFQHCK